MYIVDILQIDSSLCSQMTVFNPDVVIFTLSVHLHVHIELLSRCTVVYSEQMSRTVSVPRVCEGFILYACVYECFRVCISVFACNLVPLY